MTRWPAIVSSESAASDMATLCRMSAMLMTIQGIRDAINKTKPLCIYSDIFEEGLVDWFMSLSYLMYLFGQIILISPSILDEYM